MLGTCDAVLSGYQGDAGGRRGDPGRGRPGEGANPDAVYCCDPVMGDVGRGHVRPARASRSSCATRWCRAPTSSRPTTSSSTSWPAASTTTLDEVLDAVDAVRDQGPRDVLVTSRAARRRDPRDRSTCVAVSDAGAWAVTTPLLPITPNGCGDVTAALFLAHLRTTGSPADRAGADRRRRCSRSWRRPSRPATREIQLVAAQDAIADPADRFEVRRIR